MFKQRERGITPGNVDTTASSPQPGNSAMTQQKVHAASVNSEYM